MHIHNVYFWLDSGLSEAEIAEFKSGLSKLIAIPLVDSGYFGVPVESDRDVVDDSFSYSLHLHFKTSSDENTYQTHHQHEDFIESNQNKWHKVAVFDSFC